MLANRSDLKRAPSQLIEPMRPLVAIAALFLSAVSAQSFPPNNSVPQLPQSKGFAVNNAGWLEAAKQRLGVTDCTLFTMDTATTRSAWSQGLTTYVIPYKGNNYVVELQAFSIRSSDYQLIDRKLGQPDCILDPPASQTMRGTCETSPYSVAAAVWIGDAIVCHLWGRDEYSTEQLHTTPIVIPGAPANLYASFSEGDYLPSGLSTCVPESEADEPPSNGAAGSSCPLPYQNLCALSPAGVQQFDRPMTARLVLDSDFDAHDKYGAKLIHIMDDTANVSSLLLEDALGVRQELAQAVIRPSAIADPYYGISEGTSLLSAIQLQWYGLRSEIGAANVHLIAGKSHSRSGMAFLGAAFTDSGVSFATNNDARGNAAHEIGHVWGADHCGSSPSYCCACDLGSVMAPQGLSGWYSQCTIVTEMYRILEIGFKKGLVTHDRLSDGLGLFVAPNYGGEYRPGPIAARTTYVLPEMLAGSTGSAYIGLVSHILGDIPPGTPLDISVTSQALQSGALILAMDGGILNYGNFLSGQLAIDGRYVGRHTLVTTIDVCNVEPVDTAVQFSIELNVTPGSFLPQEFQAKEPAEGRVFDYSELTQIHFDWCESLYAAEYRFALYRTNGRNGPVIETVTQQTTVPWKSFYLTMYKGFKPCALPTGWYEWRVEARNQNSALQQLDGNAAPVSISRTFQITNTSVLPMCAQP